MVRLEDEQGLFWMEEERKWSDSSQRGKRFTTEAEADLAAARARASVARSEDWIAKVKVVGFK
jgi:hypothetical protein